MPETKNGSSPQALANIDIFVRQYRQDLMTSLTIAHPDGLITFSSISQLIELRTRALSRYLRSLSPEEYDWGRTILAEIVAYRLLEDTLKFSQNLTVRLVPTQIDRSNPEKGDDYQKGADLCIGQMSETSHGLCFNPLFAVDVTILHSSNARYKRKRPGLQCQASIPVIIWSLRRLNRGGGSTIIDYLDTNGRQSVWEMADYSVYYQLSDQRVQFWHRGINLAINEGINYCRQSLSPPRLRKWGIDQHSYLELIHQRLDETEALFRGQSHHH